MTTLTESTIRTHTSEQSFEHGLEYYRSGTIYNAIRHTVPASLREGNILLADCEGSETYHVRVELDEAGIQSAACTCPYELGGYCKHLIALLLTYVHKPNEFIERKSLPVLLENVDKTALVPMLVKLTDHHPELYNWIETALPPVVVVATTPATCHLPRHTPGGVCGRCQRTSRISISAQAGQLGLRIGLAQTHQKHPAPQQLRVR